MVSILQRGHHHDGFVRTVKQSVANVDQTNLAEPGDEYVPDDGRVVSLEDCFWNKHCKPAVTLEEAQRVDSENTPRRWR